MDNQLTSCPVWHQEIKIPNHIGWTCIEMVFLTMALHSIDLCVVGRQAPMRLIKFGQWSRSWLGVALICGSIFFGDELCELVEWLFRSICQSREGTHSLIDYAFHILWRTPQQNRSNLFDDFLFLAKLGFVNYYAAKWTTEDWGGGGRLLRGTLLSWVDSKK